MDKIEIIFMLGDKGIYASRYESFVPNIGDTVTFHYVNYKVVNKKYCYETNPSTVLIFITQEDA